MHRIQPLKDLKFTETSLAAFFTYLYYLFALS